MSDAVDFLHEYAVRAICKARRMPIGKAKLLQRAAGRVYLLLTKEAALEPSADHLDDFRAARQIEKSIETPSKIVGWTAKHCPLTRSSIEAHVPAHGDESNQDRGGASDERFLLQTFADGSEERKPIVKLPRKQPRYAYRKVTFDESRKNGF